MPQFNVSNEILHNALFTYKGDPATLVTKIDDLFVIQINKPNQEPSSSEDKEVDPVADHISVAAQHIVVSRLDPDLELVTKKEELLISLFMSNGQIRASLDSHRYQTLHTVVADVVQYGEGGYRRLLLRDNVPVAAVKKKPSIPVPAKKPTVLPFNHDYDLDKDDDDDGF